MKNLMKLRIDEKLQNVGTHSSCVHGYWDLHIILVYMYGACIKAEMEHTCTTKSYMHTPTDIHRIVN